MERKIKFIAFSKDLNQLSRPFTFGEVLNFNDKNIKSLSDEIVMRYSGIDDKNKKEIYEDDIVFARGKNRIVSFINGKFCCPCTDDYGDKNEYIINGFSVIEKVGNIHVNPELLQHTE